MVMRTLLHGFIAAVLLTGVVAVPASADGPVDPQCRLSAQVAFSVDPVGRVFGSGNVTCATPVYQITVQVDLTNGSIFVGRDRATCQAQATCDAAVAASDPAGIQTWCATATGAYQISPEGPVFDLGTKRVCKQG